MLEQLVHRVLAWLPSPASDFYEDTFEYVQARAKASPFAQRRLIAVRERMSGLVSSLSLHEIDLCAAAVARRTAGDGPLARSSKATAEMLLAYFSEEDWRKIMLQAQRYETGAIASAPRSV